MTLEHYKAQEETARQFKELQDQLAASRALCERLQAQADEMRSGRAITSAAQLAELIDGVRCFHDLGAELIAEAVFEQLPDHLPDATEMVESQWISVADRLPLPFVEGDNFESVEVLVTDGSEVSVTDFNAGGIAKPWRAFDDYGGLPPDRITHWMPLPAAPTPTNGDSHD